MRFWVLVFCCAPWFAYGQIQSLSIDAAYHNVPWEQVVNDLEARYPIKFFFPEAWVSGFEVTTTSEELPLEEFLLEIFQNTNLSFYVSEGQVIITKDYQVVSQWPKGSEVTPNNFHNIYLSQSRRNIFYVLNV